jgi:hypothetical protein
MKIEPHKKIIENIETKEINESISDIETENSIISKDNTNENIVEEIIQEDESKGKDKDSNERVYKPYKDFTYLKSRTKSHHHSSNWLTISKTLGKWIIVTGSFYLILYSMFKLLTFITTFKI